MILEISQVIWLETPKGLGIAKFLINNGPESDLQWTVFQQNGEIWTWENPEVRLVKHITFGRQCE